MNDIVAKLPQHIDSTMISCFRSCPMKFYHEFVLGLRPTALSVDLHAGACFADAVQEYYLAFWVDKLSLEDCKKRAFIVFGNQWGDFAPMGDTPKSFENVWSALVSYFDQYPPATDPVQPFFDDAGRPALEYTFAVPLLPTAGLEEHDDGVGWPLHPSGDPFIYSGRFDMRGSYRGLPCIVDQKTTKSIGNLWSEQWDLRSQFIGYTWAAQQFGMDIDTVVVRGIGILKTKISHAEAIKTYSNELRARWLEQLRRDLWRIRRSWDEGYFDYNLADSCSTYGGCPFNVVCSSPDPSNWYGRYTVRRWDPLLKNPIGETSPKAAA